MEVEEPKSQDVSQRVRRLRFLAGVFQTDDFMTRSTSSTRSFRHIVRSWRVFGVARIILLVTICFVPFSVLVPFLFAGFAAE
jgi:hypothetical protein